MEFSLRKHHVTKRCGGCQLWSWDLVDTIISVSHCGLWPFMSLFFVSFFFKSSSVSFLPITPFFEIKLSVPSSEIPLEGLFWPERHLSGRLGVRFITYINQTRTACLSCSYTAALVSAYRKRRKLLVSTTAVSEKLNKVQFIQYAIHHQTWWKLLSVTGSYFQVGIWWRNDPSWNDGKENITGLCWR